MKLKILLGFCLYFSLILFKLQFVNGKQRVPSMPKNVDVTQINASSIRIAWDPPEIEGETPVIGYNIYKERILSGQSYNLYKSVVSVDRNKLYTFIDDLEPNSEYIIRIAAVNEAGDGERSVIKRIVTGGRPPSAPRPQSIRLLSESRPLSARIEWLPPVYTYNLPIQKYVIWYKPTEINNFEQIEISSSQTSFLLKNLYYGQIYELHLASVNEVGFGENATEQFSTPDTYPDGEPLNIRYLIFKNQLTVLWNQPLWFLRNGNITNYNVILKGIQGPDTGKIMEKNVTTTSVLININQKSTYNFKVAAATIKGYGPYSLPLIINANTNPLIGPPTNVRVQAITNTSVVVQWDFDEVANNGFADGFAVKYMHEPMPSPHHTLRNSYQQHSNVLAQDNWRSQSVMDSKARHLEIGRLLPQKSYAFCVLAIKESRLGSCSSPPVTIEKLKPVFVVQNLHAQYKTSQSVAFQWDYNGVSTNIGFFIKQMGFKKYQDQFLEEKTLVSPGFEKKIDGTERQFLWQNLRPYMNYTFQVGVYSINDNQRYWPRELHVQTDPTGPPFVDAPEFFQSTSATTAQIRLSCASEEYGPINHYWLIVVPGNYTKEDVVNVDSTQLQHSTLRIRALKNGGESLTSSSFQPSNFSSRIKRTLEVIPQSSTLPSLEGVYITAQLSKYKVQQLYQDEKTFTVGDEKEYDGYLNMALDSTSTYSLMTRAFTQDENWHHSEQAFEHRPPMQEPASRLFTDSILSEPFSTRSSIFGTSSAGSDNTRAGSIVWLAGPAIVIFVIVAIVGMLVAWWLKSNSNCKNFSANVNKTNLNSNGVVATQVALSPSKFRNNVKMSKGENNTNSGLLVNETSKLLDADGRPIINFYERQAVPTLSDSTTMLNNYPMMDSTGALIKPLPQTINNSSNVMRYNGNVFFGTNTSPRLNASNLSIGGTQSSNPIPLTEFATHIDRLKLNNNELFIKEYESIETGQLFTWENSLREVNKHKNRYANVVAYDHSRVILTPLEDTNGNIIDGSDYINANYIDGYEKPKAYIATQGPLPETFCDFWRMVWEERSMVIVMLTRLEERQRTKCDQYWPSRGSSFYGFFKVTLLDTTELAHYCIHVLRLEDTRTREHRDIQHAQFTAWPDHGVPTHPTPFLMFLKRIKALNPVNAGPIITHCSAGIGRTGAFIVIDCMLDRLRYEMTVDIYGCVRAVRALRSYMVQTEDQYIFIHNAVLDAAQSGSTEVPSSRLAQHLQVLAHLQRQMDEATGLEIEFGTLITLKSIDTKCIIATMNYNLNKNRQSNVIPYDSNRVELPYNPNLEGSDYINASWIDGYKFRNAYIATQAPLPNTIIDFWRMIWAEECSIIANLTLMRERGVEKYCEYWPRESHEEFGSLLIECVSEFDMSHYILREFKLSNVATGKSRTVRQFQYMEWPEKSVPLSVDHFVDYVQQVHHTKAQFGSKGPICVHCINGAGKTGVFITVSTIIERIKQEQIVDIFTTVKLLRMQRPNMVETREQYEFCYQTAIEFISSIENSP